MKIGINCHINCIYLILKRKKEKVSVKVVAQLTFKNTYQYDLYRLGHSQGQFGLLKL